MTYSNLQIYQKFFMERGVIVMSSELLANLLFPPKCAACGKIISPVSEELALCASCLERWKMKNSFRLRKFTPVRKWHCRL